VSSSVSYFEDYGPAWAIVSSGNVVYYGGSSAMIAASAIDTGALIYLMYCSRVYSLMIWNGLLYAGDGFNSFSMWNTSTGSSLQVIRGI
jgi:hypothetical protein